MQIPGWREETPGFHHLDQLMFIPFLLAASKHIHAYKRYHGNLSVVLLILIFNPAMNISSSTSDRRPGGCFPSGLAADVLVSHVCVFRLGRTKTLLSSLTLTVVFGVLVCVSPYPTIFIITRFFLAAASSGVYLTLYIIREFFLHPSKQLLRPP